MQVINQFVITQKWSASYQQVGGGKDGTPLQTEA